MNLETLIDEVKNLFPSPQILPALLTLLKDPDADAGKVVELLRVDAALTAQIIASSNSAYYGFESPAISLDEAVGRIGFREAYRLVGMVLGKRLASQKVEVYYLNESDLWFNALACALAMENLARVSGQDVSVAYTTGLLHGIGKLALNQVGGKAYEAVFERIEKAEETLIVAEQAVLGFDHAQAGAALLERWKFPPLICNPIRYQYKPMQAKEALGMTCSLHLANWVVAAAGFNYGRDAWAMEIQTEALQYSRISEADLHKSMMVLNEQVNKAQSLLQGSRRAG